MFPLPQAFVARIQNDFPETWEDFIKALDGQPFTSIRLNPFKWKEKPELAPIPWSSNGYYLLERPEFSLDPLWHSGTYYVQEASSMFLEFALKPFLKEIESPLVLDLCAAPGGKSTLLSSLLFEQNGFLVANEVISPRLGPLRENLHKWGIPNYKVANRDAVFWGKQKDLFDVIVIDAPCSGEGMFRKDVQSRTEWKPELPAFCAARQQRIVEDVLPTLKPGGMIVYSTCTFNSFENENITSFLEKKGIEWLTIEIPENFGITQKQNGYAFLPYKAKGEGFFLAIGRKGAQSMNEKPNKSFKMPKESHFEMPGLKLKEEFFVSILDNKVGLFNRNLLSIYERLSVLFPPEKLGFEIAEIKGKDIVPNSFSAFLIPDVFEERDSYEIDLSTALKYLRKEDPGFQLPKGFKLLSYRGVSLGWIKALGNRNNNLYPSSYRLLKQGLGDGWVV